MLYFNCDYNNGCHPDVLKRLVETNSEFTDVYDGDIYTKSAKAKIKKAIGCPKAQIAFLGGGTQTNATVIDGMLKPYEGVLAADTGHVNVHEAGAIEHTGHKVLALPQYDGKIKAKDVNDYVETYYADENYEHMVFPGMVYISFPTELGTLYSKKELTELYKVCRDHKIPLFIDGARLSYGLASKKCDMTIEEFASLCDVFYIGGTKVGALCGEALVFTHGNAPEHLTTIIKQHLAMFAKGRLNGVQFDALFTDDLYFKIGKNAIDTAELMKKILHKKGYKFYLETPTNQQFVIVENSKLDELSKHVKYGFWSKYDSKHTVIRFCTSWATRKEDVLKLEEVL